MLIFPVRGPHLESTRGNGSGRAGLPVSGPMPSSAHKLAQQIFPAFCAAARWAWGHQVPSFARRSSDIPPRQEEGASSAEQPSSLSLSIQLEPWFQSACLAWFWSGSKLYFIFNRGFFSPFTHCIDSYNWTFLLFPKLHLPTLTASLRCHYKTIRVLAEEKKRE